MVDRRLMEPSPKELARAASSATQWLMTAACIVGVILGAAMGWTWGGSVFAGPETQLVRRSSLEGTLFAGGAALTVAGLSTLLAAPALVGLWRDWDTVRMRRVLVAVGSVGIVVAGLVGALGFDPDREAVLDRYGHLLGEPSEERSGELVVWLGALSGLSWAFVAVGLAIAALLAIEVERVRSRGPAVRARWRAPVAAPATPEAASTQSTAR